MRQLKQQYRDDDKQQTVGDELNVRHEREPRMRRVWHHKSPKQTHHYEQ
jgi:hypothetical protein